MKRLIFFSIVAAVIATLLLLPGQTVADPEPPKWEKWHIGDNIHEFNENWEVEDYDGNCYDYEVVDGTLIVTASPYCDGERFFAKVKSRRKVKEIRADVTVIESYGCWRTRLLADPLYLRDVDGLPHPEGQGGQRDGTVFHQLSLVNESCFPSSMARLIAYPDASPWLVLFDSSFRRPWSEPGDSSFPTIVGHTYTLTLSVRGSSVNSKIENRMGQSYGNIKFEIPGLRLTSDNSLGISCFSAGQYSCGEAHYSNIRVRF